jgi:DNA-binding ferritin-like protein
MTPVDDLDRIKQTLDYVATLQRSHDEQIGKLVEKTDRLAERMAVLTERTIQAMDAIARLARIADIHENRIDDLENPPQ